MSRVLVLYATHHGETRSIALAIAQHLRKRGNDVDLADVREGHHFQPVDDYDTIVLGSRAELGRHASEMLAYISSHREGLCRVPTAFFSVSMAASESGAAGEPEQHTLLKMFARLAWHPVLCAAFADGLLDRHDSWMTRLVMKHVSRKAGRPTDTSRALDLIGSRRVEVFANKLSYIAAGAASRESLQRCVN